MNLNFPGAALALTRRGNFWPPDRQAELEQLIREITHNDTDSPLYLELLWESTPTFSHFLEYACDVFDYHDRIIEAFHARDWCGYIEAHPQFLRPGALRFTVDCGLVGELYWQLLTLVYIQDDCSDSDNRSIFFGLYVFDDESSERISPYRRTAMNAAELEVYDALPETVTIYRGAPSDNRPKGMSWTLERRITEFYAWRCRGSVYTVQVSKRAIFAYYAARDEAEVLIDTKALSGYNYRYSYKEELTFYGNRKTFNRYEAHWNVLPF